MLSQLGAVLLDVRPALLALVVVVGAHARRGNFKRFSLSDRQACKRSLPLLLRYFKGSNVSRIDLIKLIGEFEQGGVPFAAHALQDTSRDGFDGIVLLCIKSQ